MLRDGIVLRGVADRLSVAAAPGTAVGWRAPRCQGRAGKGALAVVMAAVIQRFCFIGLLS